jgi:hypothetical protein
MEFGSWLKNQTCLRRAGRGFPRWASSAKSGLGTAVSRDSRVWFALSHGILNEIDYPRGRTLGRLQD